MALFFIQFSADTKIVNRYVIASLLAALAVPALPAQEAATQADFLEEFAQVEQLMSRRKWDAAVSELKVLLERHADARYAKLHRIEIEEAMRRCVFYAQTEEPNIEDMLSGEVLSWSESSREISLRYQPRKGLDKEVLDDFTTFSNNGFIHSIEFDGPSKLEVAGSSYPGSSANRQPVLLMGLPDGMKVQAQFGAEQSGTTIYPAVLMLYSKRDEEELDRAVPSPVKSGKSFRLKLEVTQSKVVASYNGKKFLSGNKPRDEFGTLGFFNVPMRVLEEVSIRGRVRENWLQNVIDKAVSESRAEFEKDYKPADHLPAWLLAEDVAAESVGVTREGPTVPGPYVKDQMGYVNEMIGYLNRSEYQDGLDYLDLVGEQNLTPEALHYLYAEAFFALEKLDEAEMHLEKAFELDDGHVALRLLEAKIISSQGKYSEALELLESIAKDHPDDGPALIELSVALMMAGRTSESELVLDTAVESGVSPSEVSDLKSMLVKARKGPQWERVYDHVSSHYHVFSDMNVDVCRDASRVLEAAYVGYKSNLKRPKSSDHKYRVYIFAGQDGYHDYIKDLTGSHPQNTAGVYFPLLKQLLIWNSSNQEAMFNTVRHEGFHQYLDSLTSDSPVWFNEGMAEYYERATRKRGKWTADEIREEYVVDLAHRSKRRNSVERILNKSRSAFYESRWSYAEAWALIHFMRHGDRKYQKVFDKLLSELIKQTPSDEAVEKAFKRIDMDEMSADFHDYLVTLSDEILVDD